MKAVLLTVAAIAGAIALHSTAFAQNAPTYRYCLQESGGRDGTTTTLCRYNTLMQCWASKTKPADFCYPNPAYGRK
jgi:hypothetical protein